MTSETKTYGHIDFGVCLHLCRWDAKASMFSWIRHNKLVYVQFRINITKDRYVFVRKRFRNKESMFGYFVCAIKKCMFRIIFVELFDIMLCIIYRTLLFHVGPEQHKHHHKQVYICTLYLHINIYCVVWSSGTCRRIVQPTRKDTIKCAIMNNVIGCVCTNKNPHWTLLILCNRRVQNIYKSTIALFQILDYSYFYCSSYLQWNKRVRRMIFGIVWIVLSIMRSCYIFSYYALLLQIFASLSNQFDFAGFASANFFFVLRFMLACYY